MSTLNLLRRDEVLMTAPKTNLRQNAASGRIHAAMTLEAATPAEIAARVLGAPVTAKRVKAHLEYWLALEKYYYRDEFGKYGFLGAAEEK